MVRNLKRIPDDFSERNYSHNIPSKKELLQRELDVNRAEQALLRQRIQTVKDYLGELPTTDPQYGIIHAQIRMDQIELDELKFQEENLLQQIEKVS
jgi:hypothetical protein